MSGEVMMPCGRSDLPESADMHCAGCGFPAGKHPQWPGGRSAPRRPEYPMGGSYGPIDPDNPQWPPKVSGELVGRVYERGAEWFRLAEEALKDGPPAALDRLALIERWSENFGLDPTSGIEAALLTQEADHVAELIEAAYRAGLAAHGA